MVPVYAEAVPPAALTAVTVIVVVVPGLSRPAAPVTLNAVAVVVDGRGTITTPDGSLMNNKLPSLLIVIMSWPYVAGKPKALLRRSLNFTVQVFVS
jgi:hypothetical protein